ncbi:hypothetical protein TG4357_02851 [Thalassovita gelatinovora]|uniref:Uncharacterized protein n=1 Tax=Thalassovita gelatinovora TaxID=53501 RepID=A0A0P1G2T8_THAGE|nr:hypothetical protein [Thalassovita gelatinovora]QIZ81855.1 hypothetical protein HFZ77_15895 [Thalassovita gelatinovora]CUH67176.1 hypothetical protein TG4357_02851 [Thalassovita gelatinovora]SEP79277.1 hypothetical protein SAMN04488043_101409 [Thalassovita gelatinovora]
MAQEAQVRLHIYDAAEAPVSVILRQGPSKHTRMIFWDRRDDSFIDGQWTKHKVYLDRCDLSPDGRYFIYFQLNNRWKDASAGSYTAISRPPYFTALALYPQGDTWGGGGYFVSNTDYVIRTSDDNRDIIGRAPELRRIASDTVDPRSLCASFYSPRRFAAKGGRLYELTEDANEGRLIRDFTNMQFERIRAPYDWRNNEKKGLA